MASIIMSVAVVAIGLAIGLLRGGSIEGLVATRPHWWGLLAGGFVLQATAEAFDIRGATSLSIIGLFLLVVGLISNAEIRGALVTAFGVSLNLLVLVLNGSVPVRFDALAAAGIIEEGTVQSQVTSVGHLLELESSDSRLADLGDVIPIPLLSSVISIGDLVTFAGVIVIVSGLATTRRRDRIDVDVLLGPSPLDASQPTANLEQVPLEEFGPVSDHVGPIELEPAPLIDISETVEEPATVDLTEHDPDELWAHDRPLIVGKNR